MLKCKSETANSKRDLPFVMVLPMNGSFRLEVGLPSAQSVLCPPPTRTRKDEQIVEMFLHGYQDGRFAGQVDWLPQHISNVEAIASDEEGTRIAIEHTRVQEFGYCIGREVNPDEDPILGEIGAHLAGVPLSVSDRAFMLNVDPKNLKRLLYKSYRSKTLEGLTEWAQRFLPPLRENQEFEIRIPVSLPTSESTVRISVEVFEVRTDHSILGCCGYLWPRSELVPRITKALADKLPKLSRARADRRILMLDLLTLADDSNVYEAVLAQARTLPDFLNVDELVFVRNFFELGVVFRTWSTMSDKWSAFVARVHDESR